MGVNIKTLKDRIRSQAVWQNVVRKKFRRDVSIGEADVDKALTDAGDQGKPKEETTLQLRQVRYEIPTDADQGTIAKQLAAIEAARAIPDSENAAIIYNELLAKGEKIPRQPDFLGNEADRITLSLPWSSEAYPELAEWIKGHQKGFSGA